jgi:hypothetical protein
VPSRTCRSLDPSLDYRGTSIPGSGGTWGPGNTVRLHPRAKEEQMSETIDAARKLITDRLRELEAGRLQP